MLKHLIPILPVVLIFISCTSRDAYIYTQVDPLIEVPQSARYIVEEFGGKNGKLISQVIEQTLNEKNRTIVDRQPSLVREKIINNSDSLPKADIMISGDVSRFNARITSADREISCTSGKKGSQYAGKQRNFNGIGEISAHLRITEIKSGKVLLAKNIFATAEKTQTYRDCGRNTNNDRLTHEELLKLALNKFKQKFTEATLPHKKMVHVPLFELDAENFSDFEKGHDAFEAGELKVAKAFYKKCLDRLEELNSAEDKAHVLYAYGIALGYLGEEQGLSFIDRAYKVYPKREFLSERDYIQYFIFNKSSLH